MTGAQRFFTLVDIGGAAVAAFALAWFLGYGWGVRIAAELLVWFALSAVTRGARQ